MSLCKAPHVRRWFVALVLITACERSEPAPVESPAAAVAPAPPAAVLPPAKPIEPIQESAARALVTRWLEAQNTGDFASYEAFYAQRFYGEKRAGERVHKLDRKGWLRDRKRMFARPIKVAASSLSVAVGPASATASFEQAFSQASFQDRGPKRLTLVRERGELRISTEIMLSSTVTTDSPEAAQDFHFVVHVEGRRYVVLNDQADPNWGAGAPSKPYLSTADNTYVVLQATANLPAEETARASRLLRVYTREGATCDTTIGPLLLMAAITPHFSTVQVFQGTLDEAQPQAPWSAEKIAESILHDGQESLSLVGELPKCDGEFATSPERKVRVLAPRPLDAPAAQAALTMLNRAPIWKKVQSDWQKDLKDFGEPPATTDWPERTDLAAFGATGELVSAFATRGSGCALFTASITALLRVTKGKTTLLAAGTPTAFAHPPTLVIDLDDDNLFEILSQSGEFAERMLSRIAAGKLSVLKRVPYSFQDCGC